MCNYIMAVKFLFMCMLAGIGLASATSTDCGPDDCLLEFTVRLKYNLSTGYDVDYVHRDIHGVEFVGKTYEHLEGHMIGAGGTAVFSFRAPKGEYELIFVRYRSWEYDGEIIQHHVDNN